MTRGAEASTFQDRLTAVADATERMLDSLLQPTPLPGETARPARFMEAMRYASLGGGKRLRPFLMVETARLFGVEGKGVMRAAAALEMIHCYSLVHDDLPALDNDDLRRGRPTTHRAFDEATAILVGDGLLTYAFDVTADPATHPDPAVRAALVLALARHAGIGGMVGGQVLDIEAEGSTQPHQAADVIRLQSMKTGALLHYAVVAGAVFGKADEAATAAMSRYGQAIGAAFPGRRRHPRRRGRRGGARQEGRKGRGAQQGDACCRARTRGRARAPRPAGRRGHRRAGRYSAGRLCHHL